MQSGSERDRMPCGGRRFSAAALLVCGAVGFGTGAGAEPYDPAQIPWQTLEYKASKLIFTARTSVELRSLPASEAAPQLADPAEGDPLVPGQRRVMKIELQARFMGRHSLETVWFDPGSAAALQRTVLESGKRNRYKRLRFTEKGNFQWRQNPADKDEEGLEPHLWSDSSETFVTYPPAFDGSNVIHPASLFYLVGAAELEEPGDSLEVHAYTSSLLARVLVQLDGMESLKVHYIEESPEGMRQRRGKIDVVRLSVRARPLTGEGEDAGFSFLGLEGDVEIYLDVETGVPVQVSGKIPPAGGVNVKLERVVLREGPQQAPRAP